MKLEFGKELIEYIKDGVQGEGRSFLLHHFRRGVEITLGSTIQNALSVVETCIMAIIVFNEFKHINDLTQTLIRLTMYLTVISIIFATLKQIMMLAMATIRSIAQELRNIKTVKGD